LPISDIVAVVSQVRCLRGPDYVGFGSGFFYMFEDRLYLITNRHVFIKEDENFYPDQIKLRLHTDPNDVRQNADLVLRLYEGNAPAWLEHPVGGSEIDVVALPLDRGEIDRRFFVRALAERDHIPPDVDIAIGEDVQVIGYPLGFHDEVHNLPIVRNATLASVYPVPFRGHPHLLIDSRLHSGTSGSPVMTKPTQMIRQTDGSTSILGGPVSYLVGVHSASLDIITRDPARDEPLGLNVVWFATLIPEIIRRQAS